jgi:preprotein translocase subunit SecE
VVDCDGLENRYPDELGVGGSNPSPSARTGTFVNDYVILAIWVVVVGGLFVFMWRKGHLARLSNYTVETREELKKCTWPSMTELKGSTVVVFVATALMAVFTVSVDVVISAIIRQLL